MLWKAFDKSMFSLFAQASTSLTGFAPGLRMKKMGVVVVELFREESRICSKLREESMFTNSLPLGRVLPMKWERAMVSLSGLKHLNTSSF